ncbi:MAG: TVP38/TMEM64 family protein [Peptostreptococcaceae bacterium]
MKKNRLKTVIYTAATLIGLLILGICLKSTGMFDHMSSLEEFKLYIEGYGQMAYIVFFIIQLLSIIIAPIPSNISAAAGAMVFGVWKSFFMTMLAIVVGSIVVFALTRKFGKKFIDRFVKKEIYEKYENIVTSQKGETAIALMLLLPFFPDDMINFLVGLSNISFKRYMAILIITRPWGILFASFISVANINIPMIGWTLIVAIIVLFIKYSRTIENKLVGVIKGI